MGATQVGVRDVRVNGDAMRLRGNVTYSLGGLVREPIVGPVGVVGFNGRSEPPFVEVESIDAEDVDLAALQELTGATVTVGLRNGKTLVCNDSSVVGAIEVSTEDGGFTVRFVGSSAKEI